MKTTLINFLRSTFRFADIIFVVATVALAYGLWLVSDALSFIVMGSLFMFITLYGRVKS